MHNDSCNLRRKQVAVSIGNLGSEPPKADIHGDVFVSVFFSTFPHQAPDSGHPFFGGILGSLARSNTGINNAAVMLYLVPAVSIVFLTTEANCHWYYATCPPVPRTGPPTASCSTTTIKSHVSMVHVSLSLIFILKNAPWNMKHINNKIFPALLCLRGRGPRGPEASHNSGGRGP